MTLKDLVFITKGKSVYCTIHTESLYDTETFRLYKVKLTTVCVGLMCDLMKNSDYLVIY